MPVRNIQDHHEHPDHHRHNGDRPPEAVAHAGGEAFNPHAHHSTSDFLRRFWISLILAIPVVAMSEMFQHMIGYTWRFAYDQWILVVLACIIYVYGGMPFLKGAVGELQRKNPGMMTLVALAISVAFVYSLAVTFQLLEGMDLFWELATLIVIMLLGHWLEMRSVMGASRALELLVRLMPEEAQLVEHGEVRAVKASSLRAGDHILIRPGERVPADGKVIKGESHVNESMLTGESIPRQKQVDDQVIGGSINGEGSLTVVVSQSGESSYLNKVIGMVRSAQASRSRTQHLADKAAGWLTFISIGVGVVSLVVWWILAYPGMAVERMVTVMVTACPHALGVAIPLVVSISTAKAAANGLLIKDRTAFEASRKVSAVVFDKTGTLTKGEFGVTRVEMNDPSMGKDELLGITAAVERFSQHPIATGIVRHAQRTGISIPPADQFRSLTGKGVEAIVDGQRISILSPKQLKERNVQVPQHAWGDGAETVVFVLAEDRLVGWIALADEIRDDAAEAIRSFHSDGIKVYMATGDHEKVAAVVAKKIGIDGYYAEVLPHQKVELIKRLQEEGHVVAMTGDGVNDAPALAQADIGIAVGSGTDVAAETAHIILVNSRPTDILRLLRFGKATYAKMIQNLWWATGYNIFAIPLAAGVLWKQGIVLTPAIGAVLMSLSTVIVAINAQLLHRKLRSS